MKYKDLSSARYLLRESIHAGRFLESRKAVGGKVGIMAETDVVAAPAAARRHNRFAEVVKTVQVRCKARATLEDERSEEYETAAEDLYVSAHRRRLEQMRRECYSKAEFETVKMREQWTQAGHPSSMRSPSTPPTNDTSVVSSNRTHSSLWIAMRSLPD